MLGSALGAKPQCLGTDHRPDCQAGVLQLRVAGSSGQNHLRDRLHQAVDARFLHKSQGLRREYSNFPRGGCRLYELQEDLFPI